MHLIKSDLKSLNKNSIIWKVRQKNNIYVGVAITFSCLIVYFRITPPLPDDEILGLSKEKETRAMQAVQHQDQVTRKPHVMMSPGSIRYAHYLQSLSVSFIVEESFIGHVGEGWCCKKCQIEKSDIVIILYFISSDDSMDLAERYKPPPSIAGSVASQQSSQDIGGARVKNALPKVKYSTLLHVLFEHHQVQV